MWRRPYIRRKYLCIRNEKRKDGKHNNRLAVLLFAIALAMTAIRKSFPVAIKMSMHITQAIVAPQMNLNQARSPSKVRSRRFEAVTFGWCIYFSSFCCTSRWNGKRRRINSRTKCILNLLFSKYYLLRAYVLLFSGLYLTMFFPLVICKDVENILNNFSRTSVCELKTSREIFTKATLERMWRIPKNFLCDFSNLFGSRGLTAFLHIEKKNWLKCLSY